MSRNKNSFDDCIDEAPTSEVRLKYGGYGGTISNLGMISTIGGMMGGIGTVSNLGTISRLNRNSLPNY